MCIPNEDVETAKRNEIYFYVGRKEGPNNSTVIVVDNIDSPIDAVQKAQQLQAWEVSVVTSDGYYYWSSRNPSDFNSSVLKISETTKAEEVKLPYFNMDWTIYRKAIRKEKAVKYLNQVVNLIEKEIISSSCECDCDDKSRYRIEFTVRIETESVSEAIFQSLRLCQKVGYEWSVTGPYSDDEEKWEFNGRYRDGESGASVKHFRLYNYVMEEKTI